MQCSQHTENLDPLAWPRITKTMKPWARWWWMGNAVTENGLSQTMHAYRDAGLGGLEITPIYGVHGYEDQFIQYLSPEWMDRLEFTLTTADQLGLGIDMATGTGWPFGGTWIDQTNACKYFTYDIYTLNGGETLQQPVQHIQEPIAAAVRNRIKISEIKKPISANPNLQQLALAQIRFQEPLPLQTLVAYSDLRDTLELTQKVDNNNRLQWTAPPGNWKLYAIFQGWHGKMVERAAPGGEGNVIDHFSERAVNRYLQKFNNSFQEWNIESLRGFFNDSYEVDDARGEADYTPNFFEQFKERKGYDLRRHLPDLFATPPTERTGRVLCDYREVISDLLLDNFTKTWTGWAHEHDAITRDQAHGSPGNILDLYAAADIPETEGSDVIRYKFASSAAHVTGKPLVSAEAATWLKEHFRATLSDVKQAADQYFLGGVNHLVYHGTPYSPQDAQWPGWLFYASVDFNPANTFWKDFPKLNHYVARVQSFLQQGKPDNEILVYFPIYDEWSTPGDAMLKHFDGRAEGTSTRTVATQLLAAGYIFDFISDAQLSNAIFANGTLQTGGGKYQVVIVPECQYIPGTTFEKLMDFANDGGTVVFQKEIPSDVPGYSHYNTRLDKLQQMRAQIHLTRDASGGYSTGNMGDGQILLGEDVVSLMASTPIKSERMVDQGLRYVRRSLSDGRIYFVINTSDSTLKNWIPLRTAAQSVIIFNPMTGKSGIVQQQRPSEGEPKIYLQLHPGETAILRTYNSPVKGDTLQELAPNGDPVEIDTPWILDFLEGGPTIPDQVTLTSLVSWPDLDAKGTEFFSGTARYVTQFEKPEEQAEFWEIDLGDVHESATVSLNGKVLDTLITAPYTVNCPADLFQENNRLEVEVTNLMANRIIQMDRNNVHWKKFYNVNFPPKTRADMGPDGLFNTSGWEPLVSGLLGPVELIPMKETLNSTCK